MQLPWMAAKIEPRPVADLVAYPGNARVHSAAQIEQLKAAMLAFGFTNPVLVGADGVLIAGHGRVLAAKKLSLVEVPVIRLAHLSEGQARALRWKGAKQSMRHFGL